MNSAFSKRNTDISLPRPLRSIQLARVVGYRTPGGRPTAKQWLDAWSQVVGKRAVRKILKEQRWHRYKQKRGLRAAY